MAGYHHFSKSNNAIDAEVDGRYPITKARAILAKKLNWPVAKSKAFLLHVGTSEWHHTSKFYNRAKYYDVTDEAIAELSEEIANFAYNPKPPTKQIWFKCWNLDKEPRHWDWKVTFREGKHCYAISKIKTDLNEMAVFWQAQLFEKHATKIRIAKENNDAIEEILGTLAELETRLR